MHESLFPTQADTKVCVSKAIIAARRVRNVLSLDKTKLEAQIVYNARFVCKVCCEILAVLDSMVCI